MQLISEFRNPTHWYSKLIAAFLAIVLFTLVASGIIAGYVIYNIVVVKPAGNNDAVNVSGFPGHPQDISYEVEGSGTRQGWFFPGLKLAPTILLCPGYNASRGELLPLATSLQDHQYNVFLFDFDTNGSRPGTSTLGFREVQELRAGISMLSRRDDVDRSRFGLWGVNMGAYAALAVAEADPRVRALVVESVYDRPQDLLRILAARYGLSSLPFLSRFTQDGFLWLNRDRWQAPALSTRLARTAGVPKLFLEAADEPQLIAATHRLFVLSPEPKQEALISRGNYAGMLDDEKHNYEDRVVTFFLANLPAKFR